MSNPAVLQLMTLDELDAFVADQLHKYADPERPGPSSMMGG